MVVEAYRIHKKTVLELIGGRGYHGDSDTSAKEALMIFRQFLNPPTGCASYLLG
jgi:hypothetical protein